MTPAALIEQELAAAEAARQNSNDGKARVCARRAVALATEAGCAAPSSTWAGMRWKLSADSSSTSFLFYPQAAERLSTRDPSERSSFNKTIAERNSIIDTSHHDVARLNARHARRRDVSWQFEVWVQSSENLDIDLPSPCLAQPAVSASICGGSLCCQCGTISSRCATYFFHQPATLSKGRAEAAI